MFTYSYITINQDVSPTSVTEKVFNDLNITITNATFNALSGDFSWISSNAISTANVSNIETIIDNDISPYLGRETEGSSTGIISGGELSINSGDDTKFDVATGSGYIVDYTTYPTTTTLVEWDASTALTVSGLTTSFATDIAIDSSGAILQQNSFNTEELRSVILLGGLDHNNQTNIRNIFQITVPTFGVGSSLKDLAASIGDINLSGNEILSNGANLKIDKTLGRVFSLGKNYKTNKNDPNTISIPSETQVEFNYIFDDGSGNAVVGPTATDINPNNYDDGSGTLATVTVNDYTIQRVLVFSNTGNTFIQYGTNVYGKLSEAIGGLDTLSFPSLSGFRTALTRGYIIVQEGETDLSTTNTVFINGDKFGGVGNLTGVDIAVDSINGETGDVILETNDLADTNIIGTPSNDSILQYNTSNNKWEDIENPDFNNITSTELTLSGSLYVTGSTINMTFSSSTLSDISGNGLGLQYSDDYTSTFVTNSLVTKGYVDANGGGSGDTRVTGSVTTTNDTTTNVDIIDTITTDTTNIIEVFVTARETGSNSEWGIWRRTLSVTNFGGTASVRQVSADMDSQSTNLSPTSVGFSVNVSNVEINVTGIAATTIDWDSKYEIISTS